MEAANEAARRAVNGILRASGVTAAACDIWKLHEPEIFAPWRAMDLVRYQQGLPWDDTLVKLGLAALNLGQEAVYALQRRAEARSDILGGAGAEPAALKDLIYPLTGGVSRGSSSELGQTVRTLIQDSIQLIALRSAEAEAVTRALATQTRGTSATGAAASANQARARRGKVRIITRQPGT
jgi:hypothetical protein